MKAFAVVTVLLGSIMMTSSTKINLGESKDQRNWFITNDGVLGGLSDGNIQETDKSMKFFGELSLENNGGFTRIQRRMAHSSELRYA